MTQPTMYSKEWSEDQIGNFMLAANNILNALPSSFTEPKIGDDIAINKCGYTAGRKDTPQRFAKMLMEMLEGELYTNDEIVQLFKDKVFTEQTTNSIDCEFENVKCFSFCEHHLALMYDINIDIKILYSPDDNNRVKVVGLSKIPRICDLVCKRLQLQERITSDIHYIISSLLNVPIEVTVRGKHSCVSARGIKKDIVFTSKQATPITISQTNGIAI